MPQDVLKHYIAIEIMTSGNPHARQGSLFRVRSTYPQYREIQYDDGSENLLMERQVSFQIDGIALWPRYLAVKYDMVYDLGDGRSWSNATKYRVIDVQPVDRPPNRVNILCQRVARTAEDT